MLNFIANTYILFSAIIGWFCAQLFKPVSNYIKTKTWNFRAFWQSGGFPSSHTATMSSLLLSVGLSEGFDSNLFAAILVLTVIIAYDAINVRYYAGKNIKLTKQIINDLKDEQSISLDLQQQIYHDKLKDVLGHEKIEVLGGFILGVIVAFSLYKLYY